MKYDSLKIINLAESTHREEKRHEQEVQTPISAELSYRILTPTPMGVLFYK